MGGSPSGPAQAQTLDPIKKIIRAKMASGLG
jgi:hypothetical protein